MLPMKDSVVDAAAEPADDAFGLELILAAPSLKHLRDLWCYGIPNVLDCVLCLPSLRMLELFLDLLPSALKLEFLLCRLPHLRCVIRCRPATHPVDPQYTAMLPQLKQLAQQCSRLTIQEPN
jgi:hypothetical protein